MYAGRCLFATVLPTGNQRFTGTNGLVQSVVQHFSVSALGMGCCVHGLCQLINRVAQAQQLRLSLSRCLRVCACMALCLRQLVHQLHGVVLLPVHGSGGIACRA